MNNKLQYWIELNHVKLFYKKVSKLNAFTMLHWKYLKVKMPQMQINNQQDEILFSVSSMLLKLKIMSNRK